MPPEIPGMYYDEVKKKYFKIIPSHLAAPGSKYSREAIQKREEQEALRQQQSLHDRWLSTWQPPVKRSRLASSAVNQYLISREVGAVSRRNASAAEIWAQGISTTIRNVNAWPHPKTRHYVGEVGALAWDCVTTSVWAGVLNYDESIRPFCPSSGFSELQMRRDCLVSYGRVGVDCLSHLTIENTNYNGNITYNGYKWCGPAVNISPCNEDLLFVAFHGGAGSQPRHEDDEHHTSFLPSPDHERAVSLSPRNRTRSGAQSAVMPTQRHEYDWATVGPLGLAVVHVRGEDQGDVKAELTGEYDALCVDWLDENVVVAGFASGTVILYDLRVEKWVHRLQHPSAAIHVFPVHGGKDPSTTSHQLLVAGMGDQMHMYDLRWAPQPDPPISMTPGRHWSHHKSSRSPPCISYPTYRNKSNRFLPVAVGTSIGLIATGSPDFGNEVNLIDLWTAKPIPVPEHILKSPLSPGETWARSLMFVDDDMADAGPWGPSLFIGRNTIVEEWSLSGIFTATE